MSEPFERLRLARETAAYPSASAAAEAMGVKVATYIHHENGTNGLSRAGARYAKFFRVSLEWLLEGRGEMRPIDKGARESAPELPVWGLVGAGDGVEWAEEASDAPPLDTVALPWGANIAALEVRGDSQYPRFLDGEVVLFDRRPEVPAALVGQYAIVQTKDGRRLIKIIRRNPNGGDRWRLESHNAAPEDDVELIAAWRYLGVLPPRGGPVAARMRPRGRP